MPTFRRFLWLAPALLLVAGLVLSVLVPKSVHAASTITVSTCTATSLDSALATAQASSGNTISFACSGDIVLDQTLTITTTLTIDGSGQAVTLDGNNALTVLRVNGRVTLTLTDLTIANGFVSSGNAGGIFNFGGTVNITNSTLSNNTASNGGGIFNESGGTVNITNSTLSSNSGPNGGGGIYNKGTVSIGGSIVANNTASSGNDCVGTITDQGYNLESGTDCGFTGTGSLQNTNPLLSTLGNNGGPTQTLALQNGSPAIGVIPIAQCPATDQRGYVRPSSGLAACDIGAYQSQYLNDMTPPTLQLPSTITTNATSASGAVVTYSVTASDPIYPSSQLTISCTPASGSTFAIGTTAVNCSASDPSGNKTTGSFNVVVNNVPPTLQLPSTITTNATSPAGTMVTYTVTASDPIYPSSQLTINCSPASGSTFAIGITTVNCSVTDPAGNNVTGSFQVVVQGAAAQVHALIKTVNSFHLEHGIQNSLDSQLQAVLADLHANQPRQARDDLRGFINHVKALAGKKLTQAQAQQLLQAADNILSVLG